MSSPVAFYFVDVFTRHALAGNPLSLVSDADGLDSLLQTTPHRLSRLAPRT